MLRTILHRINVRRGRTYMLILMAIGCIGWGVYATLSYLRPVTSVHVRLAAGSSVARRFQIAQCLAGDAHACGVDLEVVPTKGFDDSIAQLSAGKLDLAIVSSGLQTSGCEEVRLLAGLDVAPLHILVRRELADAGFSLHDAIQGRRVNLGPLGTNDHQMATEVLTFLRLNPSDKSGKGDYTPLALSKDELTQLAERIESLTGSERDEQLQNLPDVVLSVNSLPSLVVQGLLDTKAYSLFPFPYAQPFLMSSGNLAADGIDRRYIESTVIPAAMYLGDSLIPSQDCPTIGMRSLLVARPDVPSATVSRIMRSVFETDFNRRIKPLTPSEVATSDQIHPGAAAYLDGNKPLLSGQFFENISKALSIFGAFSAGALSLYGYLRKRRIRRPGEYLEEIRLVDALATGQQLDTHGSVPPEALARQLDTRLVKLKEQLIHDYCDNRVQGEMVLMSILSMLADSRAELRRSAARSTDAEAAGTDRPRRAA